MCPHRYYLMWSKQRRTRISNARRAEQQQLKDGKKVEHRNKAGGFRGRMTAILQDSAKLVRRLDDDVRKTTTVFGLEGLSSVVNFQERCVVDVVTIHCGSCTRISPRLLDAGSSGD